MNDIMESWMKPMGWIFFTAALLAATSLGLYVYLGWDNSDFDSQRLWTTMLLAIAVMLWIMTWKRGPYEIVVDTLWAICEINLQPGPAWIMDVAKGCMIFFPIVIGAAFMGAEVHGYRSTVILSISFFAFAIGLCYWAAHTPEAEAPVERRPAPPTAMLAPASGGPPWRVQKLAMNMQKNRQSLPRTTRSRIWQEGYDKGFEAGVNKAIVELVAEEEIE